MTVILHSRIPYDVSAKTLPGVSVMEMSDCLWQDEVFAEQMGLRDELVATRPTDVIAALDGAEAGAAELLETVLSWLRAHGSGYQVAASEVRRPDGVSVPLDRDAPMPTLARLVQEDLCLMERRDGEEEHVLTAAALCFPANWYLSEKIGRPLTMIHDPVPHYDPAIAKRVQRLFDGVQADKPLWRFNALKYEAPDLFQPERRPGEYNNVPGGTYPFFRSERQCILRLPKTRACVFSIHTYVLERNAQAEA